MKNRLRMCLITVFIFVLLTNLLLISNECLGNKKSAADPGTEKWTFRPGGTMQASPVIGEDGTIYADFGVTIYAVDEDMNKLWEYRKGGRGCASPAVDITRDNLYFSIDNIGLIAINLDGVYKWTYSVVERSLQSSPAIGKDGTIYFGSGTDTSETNYFYAINSDGTEKWKVKITDGYCTTSPAIDSDNVIYFFANGSNKLYALNGSNGTYKTGWGDGGVQLTTVPGGHSYSSPAINADGSVIYIGLHDGVLYARETINGDGLWTYDEIL